MRVPRIVHIKDKKISIFGGGDSALDWALELSKTSKVNLIHRREEFKAAQATVDNVKELSKSGKINLKIFQTRPYMANRWLKH